MDNGGAGGCVVTEVLACILQCNIGGPNPWLAFERIHQDILAQKQKDRRLRKKM